MQGTPARSTQGEAAICSANQSGVDIMLLLLLLPLLPEHCYSSGRACQIDKMLYGLQWSSMKPPSERKDLWPVKRLAVGQL